MSVTISMKAPEGLAERIEDAREDGESRSACIRRLTRESLDTDASVEIPDGLAERIEDAREDGESRSACANRLIRESLDTNSQTFTLPVLLVWVGTIVITSQYANPSVAVGPAGVALVLLGLYFNNEDRHQRVKAYIGKYTGSKENGDDLNGAGNTEQTE